MPSDRHKPAKENAGSYALHRCGKTRGELQQLFGWPANTVTHYLQGRQKPGRKRRQQLEAELGIPITAWDQEPPEADAEATTASSSATEQAGRLRRVIDNQLAQLEAGGSSAEQSAKLISSLSQSIRNLGSLTGEGGGITEAKILKSPAWRRIEEALIEALEPYPDALEAALVGVRLLVNERPPETSGDDG